MSRAMTLIEKLKDGVKYCERLRPPFCFIILELCEHGVQLRFCEKWNGTVIQNQRTITYEALDECRINLIRKEAGLLREQVQQSFRDKETP